MSDSHDQSRQMGIISPSGTEGRTSSPRSQNDGSNIHHDHNGDSSQPGTKRRRMTDVSGNGSSTSTHGHRRKSACQSCRARKVKCDTVRPACGFCRSSGVDCVYTDEQSEKLTLESATRLLTQRMDDILHGLQGVTTVLGHSRRSVGPHPPEYPHARHDRGPSVEAGTVFERSRDHLQIPPQRTNADAVLTWPVFAHRYPPSHLIRSLFQPDEASPSSRPAEDRDPSDDIYTVPGGLRPPEDEQIPALIDSFLQNVHTKNPILDVETLVRKGRFLAEHGLAWDGWSCLVLVACALGSVAKPFALALPAVDSLGTPSQPDNVVLATAPSSAVLFAKDLQRGGSCFVLACRRLGLLKNTILAAQCHFFAGVYLMYTLRPLLSWSHFYQASQIYQLFLKSAHGVLDSESDVVPIPLQHLESTDRKQRRLEQSLYWSCFKSESEFRVELPLPQSEIAHYDYPNMFPSPPSPPATDLHEPSPASGSLPHFVDAPFDIGTHGLHRYDTASTLADEEAELRQHAKKLCNEEESWYYYLTEVALRRIGNRIINTFFRQEPTSWLDVKPLISIALEFDAQVSSWSAHLPPAMQHYETTSTIRAPQFNPQLNESSNFVSRELSWATENRLLEMRSWLYQPFLYYLIHSPYFTPQHHSSVHELLNNPSPSHLPLEETLALHKLIAAGIECNLKILEARSLRHRHHGLWYDLRSTMTASLILLGVVKCGRADLVPGGAEALFGASLAHPLHVVREHGSNRTHSHGYHDIGGKMRLVINSFEFWEKESPDMARHKQVLTEVIREVRAGLTR